MGRGVWIVAMALAGCGGGEQVCAPHERLGRCADGIVPGTLTCNAAGTATECDTTRQCGPEIPCAPGLVCIQTSDVNARHGARDVCSVPCASSAQCSTGCCTFGPNGIMGCAARVVGGFCL